MNKTDLWDAINNYCVACGGSPATRVYGNGERQRAVVAVEKVVCETTENAMRKVADAARELLSVTGEIDDDGAFQACPQCVALYECTRKNGMPASGRHG